MGFESEITAGTLTPFYRWDFGDGTHAAGANTSHVYEKPGVYRVRLTVTDYGFRIGVSNELEVTVTIATAKGAGPSFDWTLVSVVVTYLAAGLVLTITWK